MGPAGGVSGINAGLRSVKLKALKALVFSQLVLARVWLFGAQLANQDICALFRWRGGKGWSLIWTLRTVDRLVASWRGAMMEGDQHKGSGA